jgi:hypothetical protein
VGKIKHLRSVDHMARQSSPLMSPILPHYHSSVKVYISQHVFLLALDSYTFSINLNLKICKQGVKC